MAKFRAQADGEKKNQGDREGATRAIEQNKIQQSWKPREESVPGR